MVYSYTHKESAMIKRDGCEVSVEWSTPDGQLSNITRICSLGQRNHQLISCIATSSKTPFYRAADTKQKPSR